MARQPPKNKQKKTCLAFQISKARRVALRRVDEAWARLCFWHVSFSSQPQHAARVGYTGVINLILATATCRRSLPIGRPHTRCWYLSAKKYGRTLMAVLFKVVSRSWKEGRLTRHPKALALTREECGKLGRDTWVRHFKKWLRHQRRTRDFLAYG